MEIYPLTPCFIQTIVPNDNFNSIYRNYNFEYVQCTIEDFHRD